MSGDDKQLTRTDLELLMESYQNMILMHQNVLDQQTTMSGKLSQIIERQNEISKYQLEACRDLSVITPKLDSTISGLKDTQRGLDKIGDDVLKELDVIMRDNIKDHGAITSKIYKAWIGTGAIIIALIAIIAELVHNANAVEQILQFFVH